MASSSINSIERPVPLLMGQLAASSLDEDAFEAQGIFSALPLEEKMRLVMSYEPEIFQVETTTRCNLRCPLCSTHHLKRGYRDSAPRIFREIQENNRRLRYICLHLMGEPLLSPFLFEIIRFLKSKGVFTYFATNGMLLEKKAGEILSSGLDKISVSLDGITQKDLGRYRIHSDLQTVLMGIHALRAGRKALGLSRPLIQVQTIMFPYNQPREEEIIAFLKNLGWTGSSSSGRASRHSGEKTTGKTPLPINTARLPPANTHAAIPLTCDTVTGLFAGSCCRASPSRTARSCLAASTMTAPTALAT